MEGQSLLVFTIFAAVGALAATAMIIYDHWFRDRRTFTERLQSEFGSRNPLPEHQSLFKNIGQGESGPEHGWYWRTTVALEQTGSRWSVSQLFAMSLLTGALLALVGLTLTESWLAVLPLGAAGFCLPSGFVYFRYTRRRNEMLRQLPETFELMARAVKAGQTINTAMQSVALECRPPISIEFQHCFEQQNLGLPQDVSFRELAQRNGIMELQMFAVAMLVQRQSGGSPVEILKNLSQLVRARLRMRGRVRALTGEARMQAIVLSILPVVAFVAIFILKPDYAQILLDRPRLIAGMALATIAGALWIRKIVNIDY